MKAEIPTCICCHDDFYYLDAAIRSFLPAGPVVCAVSEVAWDSSVGCWERAAEVAQKAGAEVVLGSWATEKIHREASKDLMLARGARMSFVADSDEVCERRLLDTLVDIAHGGVAERVHVHMDTYFKSTEYVVRPREALTPILLLDFEQVDHVHIREYAGGRKLVLGPEFGLLHHISYGGPSERIRRKLSTWSHKHEVVPGWYQRVWQGWDLDPMMRELHPTHPAAYQRVERIEPPEILSSISVSPREPIVAPANWPTVSVVIPLYGGEEDIRLCLESLAKLPHLVHEVVVVDDASPDNAADVARTFPGVKVISNETNLGFAASCNRGFEETTGEIIVFLNSDTLAPEPGFIRLVESLISSGTVAAAGPYSNNTGHHQQIASTYGSLETMPLFADNVARMEVEDAEVDMLVGFCLAVKRPVLQEIGLLDTRFGVGMFEDNDICYRMRRAGYRLLLSKRSFVHHTGSMSLNRRKEHPALLLARNQRIYFDKWKDDLETGFASALSGTGTTPIIFNHSRRPDLVDKQMRSLARKADITLCMIVRNEERVLRQCLESVKNVFTQIVIVDTGSTDRTKEIVLEYAEYGVELHEMVWPDSFAAARNESLKYARGTWICWCDADDLWPRLTAEKVQRAAIDAPEHIVGFALAIRFVDEGPDGGTQVDHIKLFRNLPGIQFEGRIHEQVLPSLRATGKEIGKIDAIILHAGYDTSANGQATKRIRDAKHLALELADRPGHPYILFCMGMTDHYCRRHEEAIEWMSKSIAAAQPNESHLRKAYSLKGVSQRELGFREEALATFDAGLAAVPGDPELDFQAALTLTQLGRLEEARQRYTRINPDISGHFSSIDMGILTFKRFHNLGSVCLALGRYPEARDWWRKAIEAAPTFSPSAVEMFEAAMAQLDFRTAGEALAALQKAEGPSEQWAKMTCRHAAEMGRDPEMTMRAVLQAYPYAVGPLQELSRILLAKGDESGAAPILEELDRLGSSEAAFFRGVAANRRGELKSALQHMIRAKELRPDHEQTLRQIEALEKALGINQPEPVEFIGPAALVGPHIRKLGIPKGQKHKGKKNAPVFSVVVVTYNSASTVGECVQRALETMGEHDELIVVDNASLDGTPILLEAMAAANPRMKVIKNTENLGYSKAANLGLLASHGEYLVTLNPDAFVSPGWLQAMASRLVDGVAAVGPVSDNVCGDQFVGHYLNGEHPQVAEMPATFATEHPSETKETKLLTGICVMVRRSTFDRHGLLDEAMVLGADDLEFSWRMTTLGYRLAVAVDVFVKHVRGVSFASLGPSQAWQLIRQSDAALLRKLRSYYGPDVELSSYEIWGCDIFAEALSR